MNIIKLIRATALLTLVAIGISACNQEGVIKSTKQPVEATKMNKVKDDFADDDAVTAKVNAALTSEYEKNNFDIFVVTSRGVTTLQGNVDSMENMRKVEMLVASIDGVKDINNKLAVKPLR